MKKRGHFHFAENWTFSPCVDTLCIVIGSEGVGISKDILRSGKHVTLPQKTTGISYNASVAAGIFLFLIATKSGRM